MDIEAKVKEILQDPEKRKEFLGYEELNTAPKKLIDCPHEIIFSVEANILEQNENHENIASKSIHKRNFHMPVPEKEDPMQYMQGFLEHFEKCLLQTEKEKNK